MGKAHPVSRRQFLQTAGAVAGGIALGQSLGSRARAAAPATSAGAGFSVNIVTERNNTVASTPPGQWAIAQLQALTAKGVAIRPDADLTVHLALMSSTPQTPTDPAIKTTSLPPESQAILASTDGKMLMIVAADPLGLVYALTELADRVRLASSAREALSFPKAIAETPANTIRGIFRMFVSEVEDKRWFYDREGWQKYLDVLVTSRFNRFNLSFGLSYDFSSGLTDTYTFFMYPFFVNVPGYSVRAIAKGGTPLAEAEQAQNLDTLKFISDQCALRGLQFNLGIWTHNYRWTNSPNATYTTDGLNAQTQAPYSRDAMKMILEACPGITGITLRTHGESGVPEGSYDLWKIIMSGITGHKNADGTPRVIELDMHGKTMTQEMIDTATSTGMPVTISCKMWAEHMGLPYVQASIREQEMPKGRDATGLMALSNGTRSFLRYGIGDLLRKDRTYKVIHRVWPGTQRLLLWGDPVYAAEFGRAGHFAGMDGIEYFEPLSFKGRAGSSMSIPVAPDRSGYADASLRAEHDWEKYLYTFRLWGRLSYNPDAPAETWQRQLKSEFGLAATQMETALANASRILPLITTAHDPAAANAQYWPEIYVNQSLHNPNNGPYSEAPTPRVFGNVTSLDPQLFSTINQYVDALLASNTLAKISPLDVARQLESWSNAAMKSFALADMEQQEGGAQPSPTLQRTQIDALILAGIGRFFANKFRAAILWQLFNLSGHEPARAAATDSYKEARDAWASLAESAKVAYLPDLTFGADRNLRRHWSDRLADIDADIAGMAARVAQRRNPAPPPEAIDKLIQWVLNPTEPGFKLPATVRHAPAANFKPNQALEIALNYGQPGPAGVTDVRLWYRHLHQGERYTSLPMGGHMADFVATVPADFTNSAFAIEYYFEIRTATSAIMYPGFKENFTGTPYFVILPA